MTDHTNILVECVVRAHTLLFILIVLKIAEQKDNTIHKCHLC